MKSAETELLTKPGHAWTGKIMGGSSLGLLGAAWFAIVQPMQETNTKQWEQISDLKAEIRVLEAKIEVLQSGISNRYQ